MEIESQNFRIFSSFIRDLSKKSGNKNCLYRKYENEITRKIYN